MNTLDKFLAAQAIKREIQECKEEIVRLEKEYDQLGIDWLWMLQEKLDCKIPLETLRLPARIYNPLTRAGYSTVGDILATLEEYGLDMLLAIPNLGSKGIDTIIEALHRISLP